MLHSERKGGTRDIRSFHWGFRGGEARALCIDGFDFLKLKHAYDVVSIIFYMPILAIYPNDDDTITTTTTEDRGTTTYGRKEESGAYSLVCHMDGCE